VIDAFKSLDDGVNNGGKGIQENLKEIEGG